MRKPTDGQCTLPHLVRKIRESIPETVEIPGACLERFWVAFTMRFSDPYCCSYTIPQHMQWFREWLVDEKEVGPFWVNTEGEVIWDGEGKRDRGT